MKKICLALALLLLLSRAAAESAALGNWLNKYNSKAIKHGQATFNAGDFEYIDDEYLAAEIDGDAMLMLYFAENGEPIVLAMQAKAGDERLCGVLACALAASDDSISYDEAYKLIEGVWAKLNAPGDEASEMSGSWYMVGACDGDEDGVYAVIGLTSIGYVLSGEDDIFNQIVPGDEGGSIWEGLEPDDGGGQNPAPSPSATPKPQKGHYKA